MVNEHAHAGNGGFGAAFHTITPVLWYRLCCAADNHLLSVSAVHQRGDKDQHPPPLQFLTCCQFHLIRLPDAAACLSTPALPLGLCATSLYFLGQTAHTVRPGFIKEAQWLDLTWPWWWPWPKAGCQHQRGDKTSVVNHPFILRLFVWQDICKSLWCHRTGHRCETKFMPAAEGTTCGPDMVRKSSQ